MAREPPAPGLNSRSSVFVMSWSSYGAFIAFAAVLVIIPGPDFAVVVKNTLAGGKHRGRWTAAGVAIAALVQGTLAAGGLSALIVRAQLVFDVVKLAGVGYLAVLGIQAVLAAVRGGHDGIAGEVGAAETSAFGGLRQGLLTNITNPKVIIFYLAVLPQFLRPGAATGWWLVFAWSHALLTLSYLLVLTAALHRARNMLSRRRVRRALDGATGALLLAFSAKLATARG
jgi:threonine/homoserine/homoserine lactone efflux protein